MAARVLIVEDETFLADAIAAALNRENFNASALYDGAHALTHLSSHAQDVDVVVLCRVLASREDRYLIL